MDTCPPIRAVIEPTLAGSVHVRSTRANRAYSQSSPQTLNMPNNHSSILGRVSGGENLSMAEMVDVMDAVMSGAWPENEIGLFLTALAAKGETIDEVAGAATA